MILGVDVGNYSTKCKNVLFNSTVSYTEDYFKSSIKLELNKETYYIGNGNFDLQLDKSEKDTFIPLMVAAILMASDDTYNKVVVGLPLTQHKENKEKLRNNILNYNYKNIKLNNKLRDLIIKECIVYPECLGACYTLGKVTDCIMLDIGGRTTDICFIRNGEVINYSTIAIGSINIYNEIARYLNSKYSLDIDIEYANRIVERGYLKLNGINIDLSFVTDIVKDNFTIINRELEFNYPAKNEKIYLLGGGSSLFLEAFKSRYDTELINNYVYANSIGFGKVGEMTWQHQNYL